MTIDDRARAAAAALHADVATTTDTEEALGQVLVARGRRQRRRLPLLAAAAALVAVLAASMAVVSSSGSSDDEVAIEVEPDPDADDAEGTPLQLLAPDDGRQSVNLPVTVEPATALADGQIVEVRASGFEPGESVGVVQCTAAARAPIHAGVDACRTSPFTQLTADANGEVAGEFTLSRTLTVPFSGTVDCAAAPDACLIGVGALSNYDRSGGANLTFAADGGTVAPPLVELSRSTGLGDGEVVHVSGSGFTGDSVVLQVCATSPATSRCGGSSRATIPAPTSTAT